MNTAAGKSNSTVFPRPTRGTQRLLKYPILIIVILVVLIELLAYFILRGAVIIYEYFMSLCQCRSSKVCIWHNLRNATNYQQYVEYAKELDTDNKRNEWKHKKDSYCYDVQLVQQNLDQLKKFQKNEDYNKLSEQTIEIFNHILKWFEEESLYTQCNYGTKYIVEEFICELEKSMKLIKNCNTFGCDDKLKIFVRLQQEFGRTCLCLSGGATMTFYQFGVIKTLFHNGLLPNIISGTSGGSLVGCAIACRTDDELETLLCPKMYKYMNAASEPLIIRIQRLLRTGFMFDWEDWRRKLRQLTKGDMTFYEAYKLTGRIFNVTAISTNHTAVLLNYRTTPDVTIWSAVIASSSLPGCMKASPLMAKKYDAADTNKYKLVTFTSYGKLWCDGSIKYDVPKQRLLEDFNVKYTICVQCNLHVFIFYYNGRGTANSPINHWGRSGMRGGFLSSFLEKILKLELRKWMTVLSDFDLIPQIWSIDLRFTAIQESRGTITISPTPSMVDVLKIISDPDLHQFNKYLEVGSKITYPYIYMIEKRIKLQNLIRDSIKELNICFNNINNGNINLNTLLTMGYDLQDTLPDTLRSNSFTARANMLRRGSI